MPWSAGVPLASARRWAPVGPPARPTSLRTWAAAEMRRHDAVKIMEAGQAIGTYNARRWIGEIDVPTTVMVTERDRAIAPADQLEMASRIPGAAGPAHRRRPHGLRTRAFGPALVRAVDSVDARIPRGARRRAAAR